MSLCKRQKIHINYKKLTILGYFNLLRKVQYDKDFVILSVSEKSKEFKIRLKALKSRFKFMDTSPKAQYDRIYKYSKD